MSPEPAEQEQAAPSMTAMMMALILQEVGGIKDAVRQVNDRTTALEGAMADVSLSGSGEFQTGRGSASAATMVATSPDRRERAPDQGPSREEALADQGSGGDAANASEALATATTSGATTAAEQIAEVDSGDETAAAAAAEAAAAHLVLAPPPEGGPAAEPPTPPPAVTCG